MSAVPAVLARHSRRKTRIHGSRERIGLVLENGSSLIDFCKLP